ncbi:MAG TPA: hypothetical protein VMZ27_16315 [Candidatus Saccharimonadales bacterium]|nr:hypothetical protein [Candidatus Saccharimonadales bacterium]
MPETLSMNETTRLAVEPSVLLKAKIDGLRRKHLLVALATGVAMAVAVSIELLALALFLDWLMELPWAVRLIALVLQAGVLGYIGWQSILRPLLNQPDDDEVALMVEKAMPRFRSRLIASLQLTRPGGIPPGASPMLVDSMVEETEAIAKSVDFNSIVSTERLVRIGALAVTVTVLCLAGLLIGRGTVTDLLKRAFLSNIPVPRKTRVIVHEGDKLVGRGDNVRLEAFAEGVLPNQGRVEVKYRGRRLQEYPLEQNRDNKRHFARTIENVQDSFSYVIYLNDGQSRSFDVKAIPRPTVATIDCTQEFPPYTKLKPVRRSLGDLSLLAGSKLRLKVTATKDIKTAAISFVGVDSIIPVQVMAGQPRELAGEFSVPAKGLTGFTIQMLDTDNMESHDTAVYRVDVLPDKAPVARITYPDRKEELITSIATMIVGIEATDDFEIAKVRLRYKVDTRDEGAEKAIELDLEGQSLQKLRRRHEWKFGDFAPPLSEGSRIEYWLEVTDNNNVTGPGVGTSEHQLAKVVSESEKRADLLNRAGDYLGSINDVANDQEKLNKNLGTIIREKNSGR